MPRHRVRLVGAGSTQSLMADHPIVLEFLTEHHFLIVLFGAFFFGESVIITASSLAAQNDWSMGSIALGAFVGTVASDTIWFLLGGWLRRVSDRLGYLRER